MRHFAAFWDGNRVGPAGLLVMGWGTAPGVVSVSASPAWSKKRKTERSPCGQRRQKTRRKYRGDALSFCRNLESVPVRKMKLVPPLLVCSSPVTARPQAVTAFRRSRWSLSRRAESMDSGRNFVCLGRGPCPKVQSVSVSSAGLAALRTPACPFWSSLGCDVPGHVDILTGLRPISVNTVSHCRQPR